MSQSPNLPGENQDATKDPAPAPDPPGSQAPEQTAGLTVAKDPAPAVGEAPLQPRRAHGASTAALALGSLGVVFGDIGTSPLYTFQECIGGVYGAAPTPQNVWGILSLIFWSLLVIVAFKYVTLLMKADNQGEGGIMALLALVPAREREVVGGRIAAVSLMVIAGAALLFGDGVITPAISVLSAIEGLKTVDPNLGHYVVPLTVAILIALFSVQSRGTGALGALFGPIMVIWFVTIAILGLRSILTQPDVLWGLLPHHGISYLVNGGWHSFAILGSVVLAVTGGEALYADMGHFGRHPIRLSWFGLVLPSLVLCYFGQGALILSNPEGVSAPFFALVSQPWARMALVLLSAAATVIASQGLISAVFSLANQAVRLGYLPRLRVLHTSQDMIGQIYLPFVNWALALACISLVLFFQRSSALAAAFGMAVSGTMLLTTLIFYHVLLHHWRWGRAKATLLVAGLLLFEGSFLAATTVKFLHGGYLPFTIGLILFAVMTVWCRGRSLLRDHYAAILAPIETLPQRIADLHARKVPGIGIYLTTDPTRMPKVLEGQLDRLRSVFETVVLVSISTTSDPFVPHSQRMAIKRTLDDSVYQLTISYGFMEVPNVPADIANFRAISGLDPNLVQTYLLGRESYIIGNRGQMPPAQEALFAFLSRNCLDATSDFKLPTDQVIELSHRLEL